jgi:hypothetical protein
VFFSSVVWSDTHNLPHRRSGKTFIVSAVVSMFGNGCVVPFNFDLGREALA